MQRSICNVVGVWRQDPATEWPRVTTAVHILDNLALSTSSILVGGCMKCSRTSILIGGSVAGAGGFDEVQLKALETCLREASEIFGSQLQGNTDGQLSEQLLQVE